MVTKNKVEIIFLLYYSLLRCLFLFARRHHFQQQQHSTSQGGLTTACKRIDWVREYFFRFLKKRLVTRAAIFGGW